MTLLHPILAGVVVVGSLGVAHGLLTDRWGASGQLESALAALDRVPARVGGWESKDLEDEPEDMARAGSRGCVSRRYENTRTRESVSVLLVCGRGGPITVHTPDVCYATAGYKPTAVAGEKVIDLGAGESHTFRIHK